jgi:hypothetical protein
MSSPKEKLISPHEFHGNQQTSGQHLLDPLCNNLKKPFWNLASILASNIINSY